ncbi:hypothetical protein CL621_04020 [archaeon]|nr:hypothetical protein [archaeon]|tara:strand:+ start:1391 stop:2461 length:1071 start_codon:yes stop_codon:yes gene_type:complete
MEEKISRVINWINGNKTGPLSIEIWPTNRCNLKCAMCGTRISQRNLLKQGIDAQFEEKKEIPEEKLFSIVEEGSKLGVKNWLLTGGGEPLIRKETTLKLMNEIKKRNMFGNINTNGTLLSQDDINKIIEMKWDLVMFSLDSANEEAHDFIRGIDGTFKKSFQSLQNFKKLKRELGINKPKIVFNTILHNKNYNKLDRMIEFASDVECEDITFIPLIEFDKFEKNIVLNDEQKEEFQGYIRDIEKLAKQNNINTNIDNLSNKENKNSKDFLKFCFEPFLHMVIKSNGEVTPCCMIDSTKENIKDKSITEIWYGKYFSELRKRFLEGNLLENCKNCVLSQAIRNEELQKNLENLSLFS